MHSRGFSVTLIDCVEEELIRLGPAFGSTYLPSVLV